MEETLQELYRGTLEECLKRWARDMEVHHPKGSKGAQQARIPMADFCGVNADTVSRWALGRNLPKGEPWFKLVAFLDLLGYRVVELSDLSESNRNFAELISFGVITPEEGAKVLGYANASLLYRMLRGENKPLPNKAKIMWEFWKSKRSVLESKKKEALQKLTGQPVYASAPTRSAAPATQDVVSSSGDNEAVVQIMDGLHKLVETMTDQQISSLRDNNFSRSVVLRLSARLSEISARLMS